VHVLGRVDATANGERKGKKKIHPAEGKKISGWYKKKKKRKFPVRKEKKGSPYLELKGGLFSSKGGGVS